MHKLLTSIRAGNCARRAQVRVRRPQLHFWCIALAGCSKNSRFVSGHDFSRATNRCKIRRALAPGLLLSYTVKTSSASLLGNPREQKDMVGKRQFHRKDFQPAANKQLAAVSSVKNMMV